MSFAMEQGKAEPMMRLEEGESVAATEQEIGEPVVQPGEHDSPPVPLRKKLASMAYIVFKDYGGVFFGMFSDNVEDKHFWLCLVAIVVAAFVGLVIDFTCEYLPRKRAGEAASFPQHMPALTFLVNIVLLALVISDCIKPSFAQAYQGCFVYATMFMVAVIGALLGRSFVHQTAEQTMTPAQKKQVDSSDLAKAIFHRILRDMTLFCVVVFGLLAGIAFLAATIRLRACASCAFEATLVNYGGSILIALLMLKVVKPKVMARAVAQTSAKFHARNVQM